MFLLKHWKCSLSLSLSLSLWPSPSLSCHHIRMKNCQQYSAIYHNRTEETQHFKQSSFSSKANIHCCTTRHSYPDSDQVFGYYHYAAINCNPAPPHYPGIAGTCRGGDSILYLVTSKVQPLVRVEIRWALGPIARKTANFEATVILL